MANIKISELNELLEGDRAYDDYLPIVDSSANETKKVSVKNLIPNNVELIAVTDTAPTSFGAGDKYYNTTTNRIYTARSGEWISPEEPIKGILYVILEDQNTFAYDEYNETLVSIGSASGSVVNNYSTSTIEGYSCNYINNTIVNAYSGSQNNTYSCDYVNNLNNKTISCVNAVAYADQVITNAGTTITDMTTTVTTTGKPLVVNFSVPVKAGGAGSPQLRIVIDGTTKKQFIMSITSNTIASYTCVFDDITAGQHTIRIDGSKGNDNSLTVIAFTEKVLSVYEI